MASVWSPTALSLCPRIFHPTSSSNPTGFRKQHAFSCKSSQGDGKPRYSLFNYPFALFMTSLRNLFAFDCYSCYVEEQLGTRRRGFMLELGFAAFSFPAIVSDAMAKDNDVPESFRVYTDDENKYKILIPKGWKIGTGQPKGFNSIITAFYPETVTGSNVSILISGLGADFTRMESFGNVDAFAETLVSGLDRSWINPPGVKAKLLDCKSSKGMYYIQYTLQNPGESRRYLYEALGMASNGWVNRLFTVTGQFMEEESDKYSSEIEKMVSSFRFI